MCARVRKRRENEVTRAPYCSQSQSRMNEPVFLTVWKQRKRTSTNQTKSSDFCANEEK